MLKEIDLEYIRSVKWYRQGGAGRPFYFFIPFTAGMKYWGNNNCVIQEDGDLHHGFFNSQEELKMVRKDISKQKNNKKYIDQLINYWSKNKRALNNYVKKIKWQNLSQLKTEQLLDIYKHFTKLDFDLWRLGIKIEAFDPWAEKIIKESVQKFKMSITPSEMAALTTPAETPLTKQEELDLLNISLIKNKEKMLSALKKHQRKYFWLKRDWANVTTLSVEYFQNRVDKIKKHLSQRQIILKMAKIKGEVKSKKIKPPKQVDNIFYFFRRMGYWRDIRKPAAMMNNSYYYALAKEFGRRTGVSYSAITFLTPQEILSTRLSFNLNFKRELQKRAKHSVYYCNKAGESVVLTGKDFKKFTQVLNKTFNNQFKEIKGMPASKGVARGTVKIINVVSDFKKMKAGNILVAPMTRPEYLPLMKKAIAVITDEGGVTCHAAIVSRELGIPCIIGTQVATEILKDGDLVEVDANIGVIKKI